MSKSSAHLAVVDELPPRDELRAAIQRHTEAVAELARITSAKVHARETSSEVFAKLDALETRLGEARRDGDAMLAARALGEADAAPQVSEADVERARADRDVARRTEAALAARAEQQSNRVHLAQRNLEDAVAGVIRSEVTDTVAHLLSKAREKQEELIAVRAELKHLFNARAIAEPLAAAVRTYLNDAFGVLPAVDGVEREDYSVHPATNVWRAAAAKLRIDADAAVPTT